MVVAGVTEPPTLQKPPITFSLTQELLHHALGGCGQTGRASPVMSIASSRLEPTHQEQNQNDDKNQPKAAAGPIPPTLAMRPGWKGAYQQEDQNDE